MCLPSAIVGSGRLFAQLSGAAEGALVEQFPEPQIMIPKPEKAADGTGKKGNINGGQQQGGRENDKAAKAASGKSGKKKGKKGRKG